MQYHDEKGFASVLLANAPQTCVQLMRAGLVPNLVGDAGIGKTAIAGQIAEQLGAHFVNVIVSQVNSADFAIAFREPSTSSFKMLLSEWLTDVLETANSGTPVLLFLDEITRYQDQETAAVIFSMLSERKIFGNPFPDNVMVMSACNPMSGDYAVNDIMTDPAWRRRLCHIGVETDFPTWLGYAESAGIDSRVIDYLMCNPGMLLDETARAAGKVYATPASWERVSRVLQTNQQLDFIPVPAVASLVGIDTASSFAEFVDNKEYRLAPELVWTNFSKAKIILEKMKEDGRADLVMRTVLSVSRQVLSVQPREPENYLNIVKFWDWLPDEACAKFNQELSDRKANQSAYYSELMGAASATPQWKSIFARLRNITK